MEKRKILACELENIGVLFLGRTGEHEATTFVFDASDWLRGYADGAIGLTVTRPDGLTYPAQAEDADLDCTLTWKPTIDDLAIAGAGELELTITAGGKVKKSARCPTRIDASMEQNSDAPTGAEPGWVTKLFEALPNIENAIESIAAANAAAEAANAAAARSPYIDEKTKNWMIWDAGKDAYVDTGISSAGKDFRILGIYETYDVLVSSVIAPAQGDHYDVGPDEDGLYTLYMYDSEKGWVNKGVMTGGTESGSVTGVQIGGQAYQPSESGVIDLSGMTAPDAAKLGGRAPEYYAWTDNLLMNSNFQAPYLINLNGLTEYNGNALEGIKGWINDTENLTTFVVENGLSLTTSSESSGAITFRQSLPSVKDGEYTGAICCSNKIYVVNATAVGGKLGKSSNIQIGNEDGYFRVQSENNGENRFLLFVQPGKTVNAEWAVLIPGFYTAETIPQPQWLHPRLEMMRMGLPTQPVNLLDNSDFKNPVNQRDYVSGSTEMQNGYFIDRWRSNAAAPVVLNSNGLTISGDHIHQILPKEGFVNGKPYTVACKMNGSILFYSGICSGTIGDWSSGLILSCNGDENPIVYLTRANVLYEWAALYEGAYTLETLPPYRPKENELAECQKYAIEYPKHTVAAGGCNAENELRLYLDGLNRLRKDGGITVNLSENGGTIFKVDGGYGLGDMLSSIGVSGETLVIRLKSNILTIHTPASVLFSGKLFVSKDL